MKKNLLAKGDKVKTNHEPFWSGVVIDTMTLDKRHLANVTFDNGFENWIDISGLEKLENNSTNKSEDKK